MKTPLIHVIALMLFICNLAQGQSGAWSGYTEYSRLYNGYTNYFKLEYATKFEPNARTFHIKWRFTNYLDVPVYDVKIAPRKYTFTNGQTWDGSKGLLFGRFRQAGGFRTTIDVYGNPGNEELKISGIQMASPEVTLRLEPNGREVRWDDWEEALNEIRQRETEALQKKQEQEALALQQQREREEAARQAREAAEQAQRDWEAAQQRQRALAAQRQERERAPQQPPGSGAATGNSAAGNGAASGANAEVRRADNGGSQRQPAASPATGAGQSTQQAAAAQIQPSVSQADRQEAARAFDLGWELQQQGKYDEAKAQYTKAQNLDPTNQSYSQSAQVAEMLKSTYRQMAAIDRKAAATQNAIMTGGALALQIIGDIRAQRERNKQADYETVSGRIQQSEAEKLNETPDLKDALIFSFSSGMYCNLGGTVTHYRNKRQIRPLLQFPKGNLTYEANEDYTEAYLYDANRNLLKTDTIKDKRKAKRRYAFDFYKKLYKGAFIQDGFIRRPRNQFLELSNNGVTYEYYYRKYRLTVDRRGKYVRRGEPGFMQAIGTEDFYLRDGLILSPKIDRNQPVSGISVLHPENTQKFNLAFVHYAWNKENQSWSEYVDTVLVDLAAEVTRSRKVEELKMDYFFIKDTTRPKNFFLIVDPYYRDPVIYVFRFLEHLNTYAYKKLTFSYDYQYSTDSYSCNTFEYIFGGYVTKEGMLALEGRDVYKVHVARIYDPARIDFSDATILAGKDGAASFANFYNPSELMGYFLFHHFQNYFNYQTPSGRNRKNDVVTFRYTINEDGTFSDGQILEGRGYGWEEDILAALREMPRCIPAIENGKGKKTHYKYQFAFYAEESSFSLVSAEELDH